MLLFSGPLRCTFVILNEIHQIPLCSFVHFQYIQADSSIHVIQWSIKTNHRCLTSCSMLIEMCQFRVKLFFNLHLLRRRKALNNCLIIDLIIFPFFYEFFLFKLYIHSLFTFYSSPQVKVNMINMSKKKKLLESMF